MLKTDKIYVAGHRGMVGSAVVRALNMAGYGNVIVRTHKELDLCNSAAVRAFYAEEKPDVAVICAARVGGIGANSAGNSVSKKFPFPSVGSFLCCNSGKSRSFTRTSAPRYNFTGSPSAARQSSRKALL